MQIIMSILMAFLAIFFIVLIHECGHFFAAKAVGIKVLRFSIGFGRALWQRQAKNGTTYAIGWIPLGGYVQMLGEGEALELNTDDAAAFNKKPVVARMFVTLAGPLANFLLAILLFWSIYLGGVTHVKPIIGHVIPGSVVDHAGIKADTQLLAVAGVKTTNWQHVTAQIIKNIGVLRVPVKGQSLLSGKVRIYYLNLSQFQIAKKNADLLSNIGIKPYRPKVLPIVAHVIEGSAAAQAGIIKNDKITSINGRNITTWVQAVAAIKKHPGGVMPITVLRLGRQVNLTASLSTKDIDGDKVGFLGIKVKQPKWPTTHIYHQSFSVFGAFKPAYKQTYALIKLNALVLYKMFAGDIGLNALGGPIAIVHTASEASQAGFTVFIGFAAFISVALGFINLLPIPALDGGHFLFQIIELIARRPVPMRIQIFLLKLGIFAILCLMLFATMNDITHFF